MNTFDLLENCIQIERTVGQIYVSIMDKHALQIDGEERHIEALKKAFANLP